MKTVMQIEQLSVFFKQQQQSLQALDRVSFALHAGETLAIVGESGSGKSLTALALMQLLARYAHIDPNSRILLGQQDLLMLSEAQMRTIRGRRIAMIFQEPMTALNPVLTIGVQISEVLRHHQNLSYKVCFERVCDLLQAVGIAEPKARFNSYPHQLSGGLKQRVMIAMALALEPEVLIADEPTTALDVTIQAQILDLLKLLQQKNNMALLLITHDLSVVHQIADRIVVMYAGQIIEQAQTAAFFRAPLHPYSQKLLATIPAMVKRNQSLTVIPGHVPILGDFRNRCRFAARCSQAWDLCQRCKPATVMSSSHYEHTVSCHLYTKLGKQQLVCSEQIHCDQRQDESQLIEAVISDHSMSINDFHTLSTIPNLLSLHHLKVHFPLRQGLLKRAKGWVYAVDDVSLQVAAGSTLALVGESGCGKTTLAKTLVGLVSTTDGDIYWCGQPLVKLSRRQRIHAMQMIFQDPFAALNPRMTIIDIITEGSPALNKVEKTSLASQLLEQVGLPDVILYRYPHQLSGGQRQRLGIARALAMKPQLIVCDEPTSALDVSVQAQVLNLLRSIQVQKNISYVFISHDMAVVSYIADYIAVMYLGRIVEYADSETLLKTPKHPYTQALLEAVPKIDQNNMKKRLILVGDQPSPIQPPQGCHFHTRCPKAMPQCRQYYPQRTQLTTTHHVHCFLYQE